MILSKIKNSILAVLMCLVITAGSLSFLGCAPNRFVNPYEKFTSSSNASNFHSRDTVKYENINGKTVTVDILERNTDEALNNPNFSQAVLIAQAIKYKQKYPEKEVYVSLTSFHLSVVASACLDKESKFYGYMKSLYDTEYNSDGFVRLSYLLVYAAKIGINVTVIGQIDANAVTQANGSRDDYHFWEYFEGHFDDESTVSGKTVGDFMTFKRAMWTSYGDQSASDMMHVKSCTVSNYIDQDGNEHSSGVWLSSTNLDGIDYYGFNGNNAVQTGVIISDHDEIRNVVYNYTMLMTKYCGQEEIELFRDKVSRMNKSQIDKILGGQSDDISEDEKIVYLGSSEDNVFEMYFTPLGGSAGAWEKEYNPIAKYISKLLPAVSGGGSITFAWNNVKYLTNFEFSKTLANTLQKAFTENARPTNRLYLRLPGIDTSLFDGLTEGVNIGIKFVNKQIGGYHSKDLQLSYLENGKRHYITIFSSLNFHQGAMGYQTNFMFVINETKDTGNNAYVALGSLVAKEVIDKNDLIKF